MNQPVASYGVLFRRSGLAREKSWHNLSRASPLLLYERCKQQGITPKEIKVPGHNVT